MSKLEPIELQIRINNAQTIQSDKNGFFRNFCENVFKAAKEMKDDNDDDDNNWLERVFGNECKTNEQRIKLLLRNDKNPINDVIRITLNRIKPVYRSKNPTESLRRRLNAEKLHLQYLSENDSKLLKNALHEVNVAVIQAPTLGKMDKFEISNLKLINFFLF